METLTDPIASAAQTTTLPELTIVRSEEQLLTLLPEPGSFVVADLETADLSGTDSKEPADGVIVGMAVRHPKARFYIPLAHRDFSITLSDAVRQKLIESLEKCHLANQGILYDLKWWRYHWKVLFKPYTDSMVLAHLDDSNQTLALKSEGEKRGLAEKYLGKERNRKTYRDIVPDGCTMVDVLHSDAAVYSVADTDDAWDVIMKIQSKYNFIGHFLHSVEMQLIYELVDIELRGVCINEARWKELTTKFGNELVLKRDELQKILGIEINPDSPAQVKKAFARLGVELGRTSMDGGSVSIAKKYLKHMQDNPVIKQYTEYKEAQKLQSSFLEGMEKYIKRREFQGQTECYLPVHYLTVHVSTGRMSTNRPNVQNIPKQNGIRTMFVPRPGYYFIEADYANIELRVLASEAGAKAWIEAFDRGEDLHRKMGSLMLRKPADQIGDEERRYCKTLNFGVVYGMNAYGLAQTLGIEVDAAEELIFKFFEAVPEIGTYINRCHTEAYDNGFVATKFGRVRWIPEARSYDRKERGFGQRTSVNTRIQGTAADINKIGYIRLCKRLKPKGIWPILNVHDSVLFEVPVSMPPEEVIPQIRESMIFPIEGYCKIDVDIKVGNDWDSLEKLKKKVTVDPENAVRGICNDVKACTKCICRNEAKSPVPPTGPSNAKIMFVGRNPGNQEDDIGVPFYPSAPGGEELHKWLDILGLKREDVWVTNAVKCYTTWDRQPTLQERTACKPWLEAELKLVKPKLIVALGNDALRALTGDETLSVVQLSGTIKEAGDRRIFCLYHPGSTIRNPETREQVLSRDLPRLKEAIAQL